VKSNESEAVTKVSCQTWMIRNDIVRYELKSREGLSSLRDAVLNEKGEDHFPGRISISRLMEPVPPGIWVHVNPVLRRRDLGV